MSVRARTQCTHETRTITVHTCTQLCGGSHRKLLDGCCTWAWLEPSRSELLSGAPKVSRARRNACNLCSAPPRLAMSYSSGNH